MLVMSWTTEELDRIATADELEITSLSPDATARRWVPIWVVRVGDAVYVRSYRGHDSDWYRHVTRAGHGRVRAGGVTADVAVVEVDDPDLRASIDVAYRTKYGRFPSYVTPMLAPDARATTLRLVVDPDQPNEGLDMTANRQRVPQPSGARQMLGDFAPGLVDFTDEVLCGQVWERPDLSKKDRSLITVAALAALATMGNTDQLRFHLQYAVENGHTVPELVEALTQLAFYAGWPKAMAAMAVAKEVLTPLAETEGARA